MRSSDSWLGWIQLAPGRLHDRRPLTAVIGVGMGAGHQAGVLEAEVAHRQRPLELLHRVRLVHAGVEEHEAAVAADRPGVAVGYARPRQGKAESVDAG